MGVIEKLKFPPTCRSCTKSFTESKGFYISGVGISVNSKELKCKDGKKVMQPNCNDHSPIKI
jgi:hypothetical protein